MIIDPYFSNVEAVRFLNAVSNPGIEIKILTGPDALRDSTDQFLEQINMFKRDNIIFKLEVDVMSGGMPFHDRFIIIDDKEVWLSGNSLHTIGDRASILIRLNNPSEVIGIIEDIKEKETFMPLREWLANRQSAGRK